MIANPSLSVCMIVKDEEENLPRALESIRELADELIIVDTGSKDRTPEIARSYGAKVYFFEWNDNFSAARNESLKHATKDYILWIDADDEFDRSSCSLLKEELKKHYGAAFYLKVRLMRKENFQECYQIRIFPNKKGVIFEGRVHEQPNFSIKRLGIPVRTLDFVITHRGYDLEVDLKRKLKRNERILLLEMAENPLNPLPKLFYAKTCQGLGRILEAENFFKCFIEDAEKEEILLKGQYVQMAYLDLLNILCKNGETETSKKYLERYIFHYGRDFIYHIFSGEVALLEGNYKKALNHLEKAENLGFPILTVPFDLSHYRKTIGAKKAFCLAKLKKEKEAKALIENLVSQGSLDQSLIELILDTLVVLKDADGIQAQAEKYEGKMGKKFYFLGYAALIKGMFKNAYAYLKEAIDLGFSEKNAYLAYALASKASGQVAEAIDVLSSCINKYGWDVDVAKELAFLYFLEGRYDEAYKILLRLGKNDIEGKLLLTHFFALQEKWEDVARELIDLLKILFPHKPLSSELILSIEEELKSRGELRAIQIFRETLETFLKNFAVS